MKFFMPKIKKREAEAAYKDIATALKSQFRIPISDKRIFSLDYANNKKRWRAQVGQLEQQEGKYEIVAIFDAKPYIVYAQDAKGGPGLTIMVDRDEVTQVETFE